MSSRRFTHPIIPAFLTWCLILLALFVVFDWFLMPLLAGRYRHTVKVPVVIGMQLDRARDTLERDGLHLAVDTTSEYSREVSVNRIAYQMPRGSADVKQGRRVWVRLNKGPTPPQESQPNP